MDDLEIKLLQGYKEFTERQLQELVYEHEFDTIQGEGRRWQRGMKTIVKVEDKCFQIDWEQGLTEYQEDSFYTQPYEVERVEKEITETRVFYNRK